MYYSLSLAEDFIWYIVAFWVTHSAIPGYCKKLHLLEPSHRKQPDEPTSPISTLVAKSVESDTVFSGHNYLGPYNGFYFWHVPHSCKLMSWVFKY